MSDDLRAVAWLVLHSRRTLAIIRQNICASLALKAKFVALTLAGYASLWAAIAADMGASLLVIFNGLQLLQRSIEAKSLVRITPRCMSYDARRREGFWLIKIAFLSRSWLCTPELRIAC